MAPGRSVVDGSLRQHLLIGQLITGWATDTVLMCETRRAYLCIHSRGTHRLGLPSSLQMRVHAAGRPREGDSGAAHHGSVTPTAQVAAVPREHRGGGEGGSLELSGEQRPWLPEARVRVFGACVERGSSEEAHWRGRNSTSPPSILSSWLGPPCQGQTGKRRAPRFI